MDDIDSGTDVYYDQRWPETELFCHYLQAHPQWLLDRSVLVLGAGMGMETLVAGRLCNKLYLNDYSEAALTLAAMQLRANRITDFELLPGRYEKIDLPDIDIAIGCFLVYDDETLSFMRTFMRRHPDELILMNGVMPAFNALCAATPRRTETLIVGENCRCVLFCDQREE
jgi:predicted nicotinamide N-methyase